MLEFIGWIGAICFAVCALPQAIHCYRTKSAEGIDNLFLILWVSGEILTLVYILGTSRQLPLIFNYIFNLACLFFIVKYKIKKQ